MLRVRSTGCAEFLSGRDFAEGQFRLHPCSRVPKSCPPGFQLNGDKISPPVCVDKDKPKGSWDPYKSRARLLTHLLAEARISLPCGPRIAVFSLDDYNEADVGPHGHWGNTTSIANFGKHCVATITHQVTKAIPQQPPSSGLRQAPTRQLPSRPVVIPDATFLTTGGYTRGVRALHGRFNYTRKAIAAASELSPWASKRSQVVWRGSRATDRAGDRARLVDAAKQLRAEGALKLSQLDVAFNECNNPLVVDAPACPVPDQQHLDALIALMDSRAPTNQRSTASSEEVGETAARGLTTEGSWARKGARSPEKPNARGEAGFLSAEDMLQVSCAEVALAMLHTFSHVAWCAISI